MKRLGKVIGVYLINKNKVMKTLDQIVKAIINSEHGWAVADQFEATFNGEPFEEQNGNALRYIMNTLRYGILMSDMFSEDALEELQGYYYKLEDYMSGGEK
jgi:hypothetical protein